VMCAILAIAELLVDLILENYANFTAYYNSQQLIYSSVACLL